MESQISLVVFDMDGVLANLDRPRRLASLAGMTGRDGDVLQQAIFASDFESDAEAGAYSTGDDYLAEFNRRLQTELTREQWIEARRDAMTLNRKTLEIARRLKKGRRIATLTNNGSLLKESIADILPEVAEVFGDEFHASYEFGARKPDPRVFTRLAEYYDTPTERVLFIDDTPSYVVGAQRAGLAAILFVDADSLKGQLADYEIESNGR